MRKSVVFALLIATFLVISGAFLLWRPGKPATGVEQVRTSAIADGSSVRSEALAAKAPALSQADTVAVARTTPRVASNSSASDAVAERGEQLMDLAASDDPNALRTIVAELNNANPEIRKAAVDATVQLGSSNAIPWLEAAAQWTENADERAEILEAAEFLKLPKLEDRKEGSRVARPKTVSNTTRSPKLSP